VTVIHVANQTSNLLVLLGVVLRGNMVGSVRCMNWSIALVIQQLETNAADAERVR
jgi:hypothetical protein